MVDPRQTNFVTKMEINQSTFKKCQGGKIWGQCYKKSDICEFLWVKTEAYPRGEHLKGASLG